MVENKKHTGRPVTTSNQKNEDKVRGMVYEDKRIIDWQIASRMKSCVDYVEKF